MMGGLWRGGWFEAEDPPCCSVRVAGNDINVPLPPEVFKLLPIRVWQYLAVITIMASLVVGQVCCFYVFFASRDLISRLVFDTQHQELEGVRIRKPKAKVESRGAAKKTMIVLGSGGHTAEMLRVLKHMDLAKYRPRCYVVSGTDDMSADRALRFEKERQEGGLDPGQADPGVFDIPRSREVGQSYVTSVFTTIRSLVASAAVVFVERPALLLCNGPGTCLPVCVALKLIRPLSSKIIFVESICRTRTLSLTGKIVYHLRLADTLFVQWPELQASYPRATYSGRVF